MADNHATASEPKRRHRVEGPKKHVISFIFSLVLTAIAFALVMSGEMNTMFIYIMLIAMAIGQVFIQMAFWMHMKDRGHMYSIVGIISGVFVVFTMVVMALYWVWW
ncbi:cytochrome C oxidase subunit IV family protein [Paenibacillus tarimensis]|uniref:cytochrome C oxidase subunit IV family protein n=1 Tax=Paenibacillus tarimensis TaxID=416012 RepID=UPI001F3DA3CC|nr:cytochrome C oxidase subunit IV family protein [Paenibacillus tarimensis]MCF2943439.1 cytochrome C oxidase subunit IV family protein [Paenibacillus tarimensis]